MDALSEYSHTGQVVADAERAMRFYREVFGFKFWFQISPPDEGTAKLSSMKPPLSVTAYYMTLDGLVIEFIHYGVKGAMTPYQPRKMSDPGLTHMSFFVKDIKATVKKVIEHGGSVIADSDIAVALFIRDPDGQLIELLDAELKNGRSPKP